MYIRVVNFKLDSHKEPELKKIADEFIPQIKAQNGNLGCKYLMDDDGTGEYGIVVHWETKEDADASAAAVGMKMIAQINTIAKEPAKLKLYKAYEPGS